MIPIRPWHAFPIVAVLSFMGREFKVSGGEDFFYYVIGVAIWGGIVAGAIWFFTRKKPAP